MINETRNAFREHWKHSSPGGERISELKYTNLEMSQQKEEN